MNFFTLLRVSVLSVGMLLVLGQSGCTGPYAGKPEMLRHPKISVETYDLQQNLYFGNPIVDPGTPDRAMRVTVSVRADQSYQVNIQYSFEFFDAMGRPLASNMGWIRQQLAPGTQIYIEGAAMETKAVDWRLRVRSAI